MTPVLRIVLIVAAILITLYIVKKIRSSKLQIEDTIFWIAISVILLLFSIFPVIPDFFARILGVQATYNFLYLFFIGILLLKVFLMTLKASLHDRKFTELVQEIAIRDKLIDDLLREREGQAANAEHKEEER